MPDKTKPTTQVKPAELKTRLQALAILRKFTGRSASDLNRDYADLESPNLIHMAEDILTDRHNSENLVVSTEKLKEFTQEFDEERKTAEKNQIQQNIQKVRVGDLLNVSQKGGRMCL